MKYSVRVKHKRYKYFYSTNTLCYLKNLSCKFLQRLLVRHFFLCFNDNRLNFHNLLLIFFLTPLRLCKGRQISALQFCTRSASLRQGFDYILISVIIIEVQIYILFHINISLDLFLSACI